MKEIKKILNAAKKVFLIADINIDLTLKGIKKIPNFSRDFGAEIELDDVSCTIGGSGFNFIKTISSFGIKIDFYGKIGNDLFGNYIKDYLEKENINDSLIVSNDVKTGITTVIPIRNDRIF